LRADAPNRETATLRQQPEHSDVRRSAHSTRGHDGQCIYSHKLFWQVKDSTGNWHTFSNYTHFI